MVLAGEDHAAHSGSGQRRDDGVWIERGGLEQVLIFVSIAPFLARERVDAEVQEGGGFEPVPLELAFRRDRSERGGRRNVARRR